MSTCGSRLRRHGYLDAKSSEERSNEAAEQGALEACADVAMQRGAFTKLDAKNADPEAVAATTNGEPPKLRFAAEHEGFNLHAGAHIAAGDDMGRDFSATARGRRLRSIDSVAFRTAASPTASSTQAPAAPSTA